MRDTGLIRLRVDRDDAKEILEECRERDDKWFKVSFEVDREKTIEEIRSVFPELFVDE